MSEQPSQNPLGQRVRFWNLLWWRWTGDWRASGLILRSPLVRIVAIIPAIGYAILYSDQLAEFLRDQQTLGGDLLFDAQLRMHLLYLGAIFILIAWAIYAARCPETVKRFNRPADYVDEVLRLQTPSAMMLAASDALASRHAVVQAPAISALLSFAQAGQVFWMGQSPANEELRARLKGWLVELQSTGKVRMPETARDDIVRGLAHGAGALLAGPGLRMEIYQLLAAHLDALALRSPVSSRLATVFAYTGALLFFAPAAETLVRVVLILLR
ncbi:hypothetical protein BBF93_04550 [Hyphomonas sp. CACIAM 19H1]|uniref:hypothetical protein n=1 Tax=Hyphomonas sp. CACIAM 19H1 TaxID=1873716 RepID=UPI000DED6315|nr:hypothetical protein [Hyphomonas sp. CACIAM 19H1]AXE63568.1 hypothetical protein BBF93_04550 [Hyphomonas sp. CACIAM 19H1]